MKKSFVLAVLAIMFFLTSAFADPERVGVQREYVLAGITTAEVETTAGFVGVQAACQAEFGPVARICTTLEVINSPNLTTLTVAKTSMLQGVPVAVSAHVRTDDFVTLGTYDAAGVATFHGAPNASLAPSLNCRAWTTDSSAHSYAVLLPAYGQTTVSIGTSQCLNTPAPVVCCVPQP